MVSQANLQNENHSFRSALAVKMHQARYHRHRSEHENE
jgi:hypothetical protein